MKKLTWIVQTMLFRKGKLGSVSTLNLFVKWSITKKLMLHMQRFGMLQKTGEAWVPMMISKASRFSLNVGGVLSMMVVKSTLSPHKLSIWKNKISTEICACWRSVLNKNTSVLVSISCEATLDIQTPAEEGIYVFGALQNIPETPFTSGGIWMSRATFCSFAFISEKISSLTIESPWFLPTPRCSSFQRYARDMDWQNRIHCCYHFLLCCFAWGGDLNFWTSNKSEILFPTEIWTYCLEGFRVGSPWFETHVDLTQSFSQDPPNNSHFDMVDLSRQEAYTHLEIFVAESFWEWVPKKGDPSDLGNSTIWVWWNPGLS